MQAENNLRDRSPQATQPIDRFTQDKILEPLFQSHTQTATTLALSIKKVQVKICFESNDTFSLVQLHEPSDPPPSHRDYLAAPSRTRVISCNMSATQQARLCVRCG